MNKEKTTLYWFTGTFLLPPLSWLISAWYFDVWNTEEMWQVLFRPNIPVYVAIFASIIFYIVKKKLGHISEYHSNPTEENLERAQHSARFIPIFFMVILPIYTTLGDFPVLLPLDFIDATEFILGISIGVPIVFLFAIPFFIMMNRNLEELTADFPFTGKHKQLSLSNKMTIIFLLSVIGVAVFYMSAVIGILHNNTSEDIKPVIVEKLGVGSLVIFGLTFLNLTMFRRQIMGPIGQIKQSMADMAAGEGDLTQRLEIRTRDELGEVSHLFNEFIENIRLIIRSIDEATVVVSSAGNELASISTDLSHRAMEQASVAEQIAASMEQMLTNISSNTERAQLSASAAGKTAFETEESAKILREAVETVNTISEKILVITEIANKTDILSLNAALEAAKAGKAGRGFAVVARAVQRLAEDSINAADEIGEMARDGKRISTVAGNRLKQLIPDITRSATQAQGIVEASLEQRIKAKTINESLQHLTEFTSANTASAEEMMASAEKLTLHADKLKGLVALFKTEDEAKE